MASFTTVIDRERESARSTPARLLSLRQAAAYLGVSFWSVRDFVLAGFLPTVSLPPLRPRAGDRQKATLRRVLIDRADLDVFIEKRKCAAVVDR